MLKPKRTILCGYRRYTFLSIAFAAFAIGIAHAEDKKSDEDMKGMGHSKTKGMDHMDHGSPKNKEMKGMDHSMTKGMEPTQHGQHSPKDGNSKKSSSSKKSDHASHAQHTEQSQKKMSGMDHSGHKDTGQSMPGHSGMDMTGFLGPYPMTREGSGTSWLPDSAPHEGVHSSSGGWMFMTHALINGVYDSQGGPRGGDKFFVPGMIMTMAQKQVEDSTFGFRAMLSTDPFMGANGYPLLLATGETADGKTHLIDRQHPHDLFMELAATYSYKLSSNSSFFVYAGLPGEPALGPSAFMHRTSGMDNPEAPITHHWLDSTHITFGVITAGIVLNNIKLEASAFRGREPDQHRYDIEAPKLDSYSARATWNPTRELSMQVSWGHIASPESLEPNVDENRLTASVIYTKVFANGDIWSSTLAWGQKSLQPEPTLNGYLLESALILKNNWTFFMRAERVKENELLADIPAFAMPPIFYVNKLSVGGIYDFPIADHWKFGLGALVSKYGIPDVAKPFYGNDPTSYMLFFRFKLS